jgi:hypothetical protein
MYDHFDDHLFRHMDYVNYVALMHGEDGVDGSLPADCEPDFTPQVFEHNVFSDEWTEEDLSDFLEDK